MNFTKVVSGKELSQIQIAVLTFRLVVKNIRLIVKQLQTKILPSIVLSIFSGARFHLSIT